MKSNVITIDQDEIVVRVSAEHEFLLNSQEVAFGYGVSSDAIRQHKARHDDELSEGKHFITVTNCHGGEPSTLWTKRGIIRLGFFIRSERAKKFRDAAEDLILGVTEKPAPKADQTVARMLELVGGLLGLGYAQDAAADAAMTMLGSRRMASCSPGRPRTTATAIIIADILGERSLTWTQLWDECREQHGMAASTFDKRLNKSVEFGLVSRRVELGRSIYSAVKQEASA